MRAKPTTRRIALFVLTAVALAVVVWSFAALSAPRKQAPEKKSPIVEAQRLADDAEKAASLNQTATALSLVERALQADPRNRTALRVKTTLSAPATSAQNGSSTQGSEPAIAASGAFDKPVADLTTLLPTSFKGWKQGEVVSAKPTALVTFEPSPGDASSGAVMRVAMYARDAGSAAAAAKAVTVYKRAYPKKAASVRLAAVDAYFGTDGKQLAAVGFVRGRYSFEIIVSAVPGVDPATLKQVAVDAAAAMPAAR